MSLRQSVEAIWENGGHPRNATESLLAAGLRVASVAYGIGSEMRSLAYSLKVMPSRCLDVPVISIGNLTVGGTGKTPIVMEVARILQQAGLRPAIVSRGYRRSTPANVLVVSDGDRVLVTADQGGDEPVMMARDLPGVSVVVGPRRYDAALEARNAHSANAIILDDGFQHRGLARDCDIVLWDTTRPYDSLSLLPRGPMREEIWALRRAHALVFTRCNIGLPKRKILSRIKRFAPHLIIFRCDLVINALEATSKAFPALQPDDLYGTQVGAFCGIGNPGSFWQLLEKAGSQVTFRRAYRDHHKPTSAELDACMVDAKASGAKYLLMTEKDFINLPANWPGNQSIDMPAYVVYTEIDWGSDAERFQSYLLRQVS